MSEKLLSVDEALARILDSAKTLEAEVIDLYQAYGRTLAEDLRANRTHPPFISSAMDGYALRAEDAARPGARLRLIGQSTAGGSFSGQIKAGEAVRIFTGAVLPKGADSVIMQEYTRAQADNMVVFDEAAVLGRHIRPAGQDFSKGQLLLHRGRRLNAPEVSLAAAMNLPKLRVTRKPRVAILCTGDELVMPGQQPGPDQIVASNQLAVGAYVLAAGGEPIQLGLIKDEREALAGAIDRARGLSADVLVTLGGASVGDYDLVQPVLREQGMRLDFWKIAMRPGKPLLHGSLGKMQILGLPGNPVSSIVCSLLFLIPLIEAMSGSSSAGRDISEPAKLAAALPANDVRRDYIRAAALRDEAGGLLADAFAKQDSSMLRLMSQAECLIIRPPNSPAAQIGDSCQILRLNPWV